MNVQKRTNFLCAWLQKIICDKDWSHFIKNTMSKFDQREKAGQLKF